MKNRSRLLVATGWLIALSAWAASQVSVAADEIVLGRKEVAAQQDADVLAAAERRNLGQESDTTRPYPEARLHQDWIYQDYGLDCQACFQDKATAARERRMVERVVAELVSDENEVSLLRSELAALIGSGAPGVDPRWRALYLRACQLRRRFARGCRGAWANRRKNSAGYSVI
jgi:hypothetical protein